MNITKDQIKCIHALLPDAIKSDSDQKQFIVTQFTRDLEKRSTKDLSFDQANAMIERFGGKSLQYDNWAFFDFKNTQHKYIYSLLMQHGWTVYSGKYKRHIADLQRFSDFLKSHRSPVQKKLKDMTKRECSKLITALENIILKNLSSKPCVHTNIQS